MSRGVKRPVPPSGEYDEPEDPRFVVQGCETPRPPVPFVPAPPLASRRSKPHLFAKGLSHAAAHADLGAVRHVRDKFFIHAECHFIHIR